MPVPQPPILEVYYSPTCAPCRLELPAVAEFARLDGSRVRIVILDQETRARDELKDVALRLVPMAVSVTDKNPRNALRAAGDADGMLPYARVVTPEGKVCSNWRGMLTLARAQNLVRACINMVTSPGTHRS
jgi:hypothetical protein